jgi:glucose 1-dehydrogenase
MAQSPPLHGYTIQAGLGSVEEVRKMMTESVGHFGRLDVL